MKCLKEGLEKLALYDKLKHYKLLLYMEIGSDLLNCSNLFSFLMVDETKGVFLKGNILENVFKSNASGPAGTLFRSFEFSSKLYA